MHKRRAGANGFSVQASFGTWIDEACDVMWCSADHNPHWKS